MSEAMTRVEPLFSGSAQWAGAGMVLRGHQSRGEALEAYRRHLVFERDKAAAELLALAQGDVRVWHQYGATVVRRPPREVLD